MLVVGGFNSFIRYVALFISTLFFGASHVSLPVLTLAEQLKDADGATINLWSEHHYYDPEIDEKQFDAFVQKCRETDATLPHKRIIMVESPADLCTFFVNNPKITTHLIGEFKKDTLQKTKAKNIEIRNISGAASFIMSCVNPHEIFPDTLYNAHDQVCKIGALSWSDLRKEYADLHSNLLSALNGQGKGELLSEKYKDMQDDYQRLDRNLKCILDGDSICVEELHPNILECSKYLYEYDARHNQNNRQIVQCSIINAFSQLLDLHITNAILKAQKKYISPNIHVVAGGTHITNVRSLLVSQLGMKYVGFAGEYQGEKPLSTDELIKSFDTKKSSCCTIV